MEAADQVPVVLNPFGVAIATIVIGSTFLIFYRATKQKKKKKEAAPGSSSSSYPFPPQGPTFAEFLDAATNNKMTACQIKWVEEYGEIFSIKSPLPTFIVPDRVFVADVTVCKDLLIKQANMYRPPSNFSSRPSSFARATRSSVGTSVTGLVGEEWRWRKEALLKEFHRARMISSDRGLLEAIVRAGNELCEKLERGVAKTTGENKGEDREEIKIDILMTRGAVKVILYFLFGRDLEFDSEELAVAAKNLMDYLVHTLVQPAHSLLKYFPGSSCRTKEQKKVHAWKVVDSIVEKEIELMVREANGDVPVAADRKPGSVLASLLAKEPRFSKGGIGSIKAEVRVFILAGFETTAHALSFSFGMLAENPSLADSLAREVEVALGGKTPSLTGDTLRAAMDKTPTVRNFFLEALRLYPLAPALGGYCTNDIVITTRKGDKKYLLPKSTEVTFPNMVMQRDAVFAKGGSSSDDPSVVDPERWNVPVADQPFLNVFNNGAHVCPGKNLSLLEGHVFLLMACPRFRFEFPQGSNGKVGYTENMLLRPKDSMPLIVKKR